MAGSRTRHSRGETFIATFDLLRRRGEFFDDDKVADLGGNDGTAAHFFYMHHKNKPLIVDCVKERTDYAVAHYSLPAYNTFIESMPDIADKSIDWGYCSHALEHLRDVTAGLNEIKRIVKNGCIFVVPITNDRHNHAHTTNCETVRGWLNLVESHGWTTELLTVVPREQIVFLAKPCE